MYRRLLCLLLVLALSLSLLACGKQKNVDATIPTEDAATEQQEPTTVTIPPEPVEPGVLQKDQTGETDEPHAEIETDVQPDSGEPLPEDVTVSVGVVEGADDGGLDEENMETTQPVNPTQPTEPTPTTKPEEGSGSSDPLDENYDITTLTYESYIAMSGAQQQAVIDQFSDAEMFLRWYKAAEAKYKEEHPNIEIDGGEINAGDLIG